MKRPIYLDSHATTPVDPRVLDEMLPYFGEAFGNASSTDHLYGTEAAEAVEKARERIADVVGARSATEIVFTSGATESNNTAIVGMVEKKGIKISGRPHIITCTTEHKAVLDVIGHLEASGAATVTYVPVDEHGLVDPAAIEAAITEQTALISIMMANNEVGTVHDMIEIGQIARNHGVVLHTDAAQAVGHMHVDVEKMSIGLMSFSAHKLYGPKGIGALYIRGLRPRVSVDPMVRGGGQERGIRSGTLNVPGVVGFGTAVKIADTEMDAENQRYATWASQMIKEFEATDGLLNGHPTKRLIRNINMFFPGIESRAVINSVSRDVAISSGSACTTQSVEPSHVIMAMGLGKSRAHSSIRIGFARFNTNDEVDRSADLITDAILALRRCSGC